MPVFSLRSFASLRVFRSVTFIALGFLALGAYSASAQATPAATVTTLTAPSGTLHGNVPAKFTVAVTSGSFAVTVGQVALCPFVGRHCSPSEGTLLQLRSDGTATGYIHPAIGSGSVTATFLGTKSFATSNATEFDYEATFLSVIPTSTTLAASGSAGNYTLTATTSFPELSFGTGAEETPAQNMVFTDTSNADNQVAAITNTGGSTVGTLFVNGAPLTAGTSPSQVATGDFNGDGFMDIAVANAGDKTISIFLSNGDGTFQPGVTYAVGSNPGALITADFNSGGFTDIAVVNRDDNTLSILLGNGNGTFQAQTVYATGHQPYALATVDFDGDGRADIVVVNRSDNTVGIFLNTAAGTFLPQVTYVTGNDPRSVSAGNLNNDGIADIAVANFADNTLSLFNGVGDGTLAAPTTMPTGNGPDFVSLFDLDDAGRSATVYLNFTDNTMTIIPYSRRGVLETASTYATGVGPLAVSFAFLHFSQDNEPAVINSDNTVSIFQDDGNFSGGFVPDSQNPTYPVAAGSSSIAIGNFNGDGRPDLVIGGNALTVLLQTEVNVSTYTITGVSVPGNSTSNVVASIAADSVFGGSTSNPVSLTDSPIITTTGLVTTPDHGVLPGQTDTLTATISPAAVGGYAPGGTVTFYDGTTPVCTAVAVAGAAASCTTGALPIALHRYTAVYSGDAFFTTSTSPVRLLPVSNPSATTLALSATSTPAGTPIVATATVSDLNGLTHGGIVNFCDASAATCTGISLLASAQVEGTLGTHPGTAKAFLSLSRGTHSIKAVYVGTIQDSSSSSAAQTLAVTGTTATASSLASSGAAGSYTLTDTVTGLGHQSLTGTVSFPDTGNASYTAKTASVGTTTFASAFNTAATDPTPAAGHGVGSLVTGLVTGDFNGDGNLDIAYADSALGNIGVRLGTGTGTFGAQQLYLAGPDSNAWVSGLATGDFNGDGKLDIAVIGYEGDNGFVAVFYGHGDGTFSATADLRIDTGALEAESIAVGDFDHDGQQDIAIGAGGSGDDTGSDTVMILLGNGDGTFKTGASYLASYGGVGMFSLTAVDLNGDGVTDLAYSWSFGDEVDALLGVGDGTFRPFIAYSGDNSDLGLNSSMVIADFNGDGKQDAAIGFSGSNIVILNGNGDGTFTWNGTAIALNINSDPGSLFAADITGDGILDIAVSHATSGGFSVLSGKGDGTFGAEKRFSAPGDSSNGNILVGDFNNDGMADIAYSSLDAQQVFVLTGKQTTSAQAKATAVSIPGGGTHLIDAVYPGDTFNLGSTSNGVTLTGTQFTSSTVLAVSPAAAVVPTTAITLTATVSASPSSGFVATGTATFKEGTTTLGTGPVTAGAATFTLTPATGNHSYTAVYGGDTNFKTSTSSALAVTVFPAPTITFSVPDHIFGDAAFNVSATSNSAGAITYSVVSGPATISGAKVTLTGAGTVVLKATQAAQANTFIPGSQTATFNVAKGTAAVALGGLAQTYNGSPRTVTAATTPSGLTVTFTHNGLPTAPSGAGSYTVVGTVVSPNYQGSATGTLVISKAIAAIVLGGLNATYDGTAHAATATTTPSGLTIGFTYNGSTIAPTQAGSYAVVATVNDANYQGSQTATLVISAGAGTVLLTTTAVVSKVAGGYQVVVTEKNTATGTASSVRLTVTALGTANGATIPASLGNIASGGSASVTLTFPASAGASGATVVEKFTGTYTGGTFTSSFRAVLP